MAKGGSKRSGRWIKRYWPSEQKGTWTWDEEERKKLASPFPLTFPSPGPCPLSAANLLPRRVSYRSYRSSQRDADNRDFHSPILPHRWWPWRNCFRDKWNLFSADAVEFGESWTLFPRGPFQFRNGRRMFFNLSLLISPPPLPPRGISILIFFSPTPSSPTFRSVSRINLHSFGFEQAWILFTSRQIFAATLYERNVFVRAANHPFVSRHQTERKTLGRDLLPPLSFLERTRGKVGRHPSRMSVTRALRAFPSCLRCHLANDHRFEFAQQIVHFRTVPRLLVIGDGTAKLAGLWGRGK